MKSLIWVIVIPLILFLWNVSAIRGDCDSYKATLGSPEESTLQHDPLIKLVAPRHDSMASTQLSCVHTDWMDAGC